MIQGVAAKWSFSSLSAKHVFMQLAILWKIAISTKLNIFKSPSFINKATYKNAARFFPRNLRHGEIYCFLLTCKTQTLDIDHLMGWIWEVIIYFFRRMCYKFCRDKTIVVLLYNEKTNVLVLHYSLVNNWVPELSP